MKLQFLPFVLFTVLALSSCGNSETTEQAATADTVINALAAPAPPPPDPCDAAANCGNAECQDKIVGVHELPSPAHFQNMLDAYRAENSDYDTTPLRKTANQINNMIGTADCATNRIQFDISTTPITLKVIPGYFVEGETNTYSIALFKGIIAKGATSFKFYRAKNIAGNYGTLAIYAHNANNSYEYFGDLSDAHPGQPTVTGGK